MREIREATNQAMGISGQLQTFLRLLTERNTHILGNLKARIEGNQFSSYAERNALHDHWQDRQTTIVAVQSYLHSAILQLNKLLEMYSSAFGQDMLQKNTGEMSVYYNLGADTEPNKPKMPNRPIYEPNSHEEIVPQLWNNLSAGDPREKAIDNLPQDHQGYEHIRPRFFYADSEVPTATFSRHYKVGESLILDAKGTPIIYRIGQEFGYPFVEAIVSVDNRSYVVQRFDYNRMDRRVYFHDVSVETKMDLPTRTVTHFIFHRRKKKDEETVKTFSSGNVNVIDPTGYKGEFGIGEQENEIDTGGMKQLREEIDALKERIKTKEKAIENFENQSLASQVFFNPTFAARRKEQESEINTLKIQLESDRESLKSKESIYNKKKINYFNSI